MGHNQRGDQVLKRGQRVNLLGLQQRTQGGTVAVFPKVALKPRGRRGQQPQDARGRPAKSLHRYVRAGRAVGNRGFIGVRHTGRLRAKHGGRDRDGGLLYAFRQPIDCGQRGGVIDCLGPNRGCGGAQRAQHKAPNHQLSPPKVTGLTTSSIGGANSVGMKIGPR